MKIDAIENLEIVPTPKNYYQRSHVLECVRKIKYDIDLLKVRENSYLKFFTIFSKKIGFLMKIGGIFVKNIFENDRNARGLCNYSRRRETRLTVYPAIEVHSGVLCAAEEREQKQFFAWHF